MASALRIEERDQSHDPAAVAYLRKRGRDFIISFYGALRAIRLYPVEHTAVQKTLAELAQVAREIVERERELEFRMAGEFLFLNSTRLRLDLTNYATFGYLLRVCRTAGVGALPACLAVRDRRPARAAPRWPAWAAGRRRSADGGRPADAAGSEAALAGR